MNFGAGTPVQSPFCNASQRGPRETPSLSLGSIFFICKMNGLYYMIYEILDFMILSYIFFFFRKHVLKVNMFSPLLFLGGNIPPMPPRGFCVVNGPPTRVPESFDIAHPILCLCIFFWKKWPMAVRSMYGSYILLAEKHRCECSDVRESVHRRPTPGADTSIQPLSVIGSEEEKPPHRKISGKGWLLIWDEIRGGGTNTEGKQR